MACGLRCARSTISLVATYILAAAAALAAADAPDSAAAAAGAGATAGALSDATGGHRTLPEAEAVHHFRGLWHGLFPNASSSSDITSAPHDPSSAPRGFLVTMVRNNKQQALEWVAFHLAIGFDAIVVYDDNSTDGLRDALAPFIATHRVHYKLWPPPEVPKSVADWVEQHPPTQPNFGKATVKYHLALNLERQLGKRAGSRFMVYFDVDEYVFPCARAGESWQQRRQHLWAQVQALTSVEAPSVQLQCVKFGLEGGAKVGGQRQPQPQGSSGISGISGSGAASQQLLIERNLARAPYQDFEPHAYNAIISTTPDCAGGKLCQTDGRYKMVYRTDLIPDDKDCGFHGTSQLGLNKGTEDRISGLCCNHYMFQNLQEIRDKVAKNVGGRSSEYDVFVQSQQVQNVYSAVLDQLIWQYLQDTRSLMHTASTHFAQQQRQQQHPGAAAGGAGGSGTVPGGSSGSSNSSDGLYFYGVRIDSGRPEAEAEVVQRIAASIGLGRRRRL